MALAAFSVAPRLQSWPTPLTWGVSFTSDCRSCISNDLNSSLYAAKGFALFGLQLGSDISDPQSLENKAIKVSIRLRLCCTRKCSLRTWITPYWTPRPSFKTSIYTLFFLFLVFFFIPLTCPFIVHCPGTPSPVSNLPLDWSCILLQSQLFIILSPAAAA